MVARRAHNPKVVGSNPAPATNKGQIAQSVEQRTENPCVGSSILPLATKINTQCNQSITLFFVFMGAIIFQAA